MMEQTVWSRVRTGATLVARLVLGAVFALAALAKITAPELFRQDVAAYHLLPMPVVGPFALALGLRRWPHGVRLDGAPRLCPSRPLAYRRGRI